MPEGPEIETEHLRETIHEPPSGSLLRNIALSTALFAAMGAVAALRAGDTVNEALARKTEATQLQAQASDQWTYYQAKGIKAAVQEGIRAAWAAAGKPAPPEVEKTIERYNAEQKEIDKAAREKERARDEKSEEAEKLLHQHHRFANSVALIQVSIALSAVAALTRQRLIWLGSLTLGVIGAVMFALTFVRP
jgi:uncharacterized protein DUF4337